MLINKKPFLYSDDEIGDYGVFQLAEDGLNYRVKILQESADNKVNN